MAYLAFIGSVLLVALSLCHLENQRRSRGTTGNHALLLAGLAAHLTGTGVIAWSGGAPAGIAAFILIPVVASGVHSLLLAPASRARRLRTRSPGAFQESPKSTPASR